MFELPKFIVDRASSKYELDRLGEFFWRSEREFMVHFRLEDFNTEFFLQIARRAGAHGDLDYGIALAFIYFTPKSLLEVYKYYCREVDLPLQYLTLVLVDRERIAYDLKNKLISVCEQFLRELREEEAEKQKKTTEDERLRKETIVRLEKIEQEKAIAEQEKIEQEKIIKEKEENDLKQKKAERLKKIDTIVSYFSNRKK